MSNLLQSASILLTPTAYTASKIECIKPNTSVGDFDFTRATTATRVNSSGLIESVLSGLPRIDFLQSSSDGHWLFEPESTNKITESENVNGGGNSPQNMDRTLNVAVAPDGTTTADLCIPNTTAASHQAYQYRDNDTSTSFVSGSNYAWSVFVKPNTTNGAQFVQMATFISTGGSNKVNFDIVNGTITQTGFESSKIENYGNGWFRCSIVFAALRDSSAGANDGWSLNLITAGDSSRAESFAGDGSSNGVLVWGAQFEEQIDFTTSYIPTNGSAVTRNKDEANSSGDTSLINSTEGVLYAEIAALADDTIQRSISLSNSTIQNTVEIFYNSGTNQVSFRIRAANSNVTVQNKTVSDRTQFIKVALKYKSGDIEGFINGVKEVDRTDSFSFSDSLSELAFDRGGNQSHFEGKVKSVAVFKEFLNNDELEALTGEGFSSFAALAAAGGFTII